MKLRKTSRKIIKFWEIGNLPQSGEQPFQEWTWRHFRNEAWRHLRSLPSGAIPRISYVQTCWSVTVEIIKPKWKLLLPATVVRGEMVDIQGPIPLAPRSNMGPDISTPCPSDIGAWYSHLSSTPLPATDNSFPVWPVGLCRGGGGRGVVIISDPPTSTDT